MNIWCENYKLKIRHRQIFAQKHNDIYELTVGEVKKMRQYKKISGNTAPSDIKICREIEIPALNLEDYQYITLDYLFNCSDKDFERFINPSFIIPID